MKKNLPLIVLLCIACSSFSQNNYWKRIDAKEVTSFTKGQELYPGDFKPAVYKLFTLNENDFSVLLKQSPNENYVPARSSNFIISIPVANGNIEKFRIAESPVMEPKLQAKYPNIRTYLGQGVTDPSSIIRFDFSPEGFHAIIISPKRATVYINPVLNAKQVYTVFDRNNMPQEKVVFDCRLDRVLNSAIQGTEKVSAFISSDNYLRTYRFAVATGGEFSKLFLNSTETTDAQRKAKVLAGLVTDIMRTNVIFEADFGIHLNLVNNEDSIIFLDGKTDPFQSSQTAYYTGKWNTQAQQAIDQYIGSANYDVGHLLMGYATGGNAGCIGCVCDASKKGSGVTGFKTNLTSDPFVVDFWDHEIGHQFGANHTFDYSYEGSGAQMEPGSGSTIMGYAGTTGTTDVQPHSDPYFNGISIQQINAYITTGEGNACAILTNKHDNAPTANAGADHTIPKSTPFTLTAKSTDKDSTDFVTYCWEQFDSFIDDGTSNKFPNANSTTGPVFRSFTPTVSKQRTFPSLNSIADGTNGNKWEVLPAVSRTLHFRLTVRDNHAGGGRTSNDDMTINVDGSSGPFTVTSPNTNVSWKAGSSHKITWDVANTDLAPVNCTKVKILLSLDGGETFGIVLKNTTTNDGAVTITLPEGISTTHARIKVMAVGNIFFDISNADFTITAAPGFAAISGDATITPVIKVQPNPAKTYTTVIFNTVSGACRLTLTTNEGKKMFTKTLNVVTKGTTEKISLAGLSKGVYFLIISTDTGTQTEKIIVQ